MAPTTPIAYKPGQSFEILGHRQDHNGNCNGDDERNARHAVGIETGELRRASRRPVPSCRSRQSSATIAVLTALIRSKTENDADDDAKALAKARSGRRVLP